MTEGTCCLGGREDRDRQRPKHARLEQCGDLAKQLGEPLSSALPAARADVPNALSPAEQLALRRLVSPHAFVLHGLSQLPDGSAYLAATPIS